MHIHEPHHLPAEVPDPAAQDEVTVIPLKIEDWLTVIVMGLLALITFANVLVRYFTKPVLRLDRRVLGVPDDRAGLVAGSAAVARNRHIRIEFFADSGSAARQRALARFGAPWCSCCLR
jgi:TRAP-type C4-dicarboxylate transport system permease small subunit